MKTINIQIQIQDSDYSKLQNIFKVNSLEILFLSTLKYHLKNYFRIKPIALSYKLLTNKS